MQHPAFLNDMPPAIGGLVRRALAMGDDEGEGAGSGAPVTASGRMSWTGRLFGAIGIPHILPSSWMVGLGRMARAPRVQLQAARVEPGPPDRSLVRVHHTSIASRVSPRRGPRDGSEGARPAPPRSRPGQPSGSTSL